jgi:DNA-binding beta-propeller fold protein YncE
MSLRPRVMRAVRMGAAVIALLLPAVGTSSLGATRVADLTPPAAVRVSGEPGGLAVDALTARAYAVDTAENVLAVFDLGSGQPIAYASTGVRPGQVVLGPAAAYVSNFEGRSISVVDLRSNAATATIAAGGLGLALDAKGGRHYAAESGRIAVLDATTYKLVASIPAPAGANVWGLALDPVGGRVFATDIAAARLLVFDALDGRLVREIGLPASARFGIAYVAGQVVVATYTDRDPQLLVLDALSGSVLTRRPALAFTNALAVDAKGTVFATSASEGAVRSADTGAPATLADAKIADGVGGIALNPLTGEPLVVTKGGAAPPVRTLPQAAPVVRP